MISNDKLEQFLLLAKGLRGLALSDLITKATAEPGLFTFGELLILPQVQQVNSNHIDYFLTLIITSYLTLIFSITFQLGDGEHVAALSLLKLFAYGTLADYHASSSKYGSLSEPQKRKLQILTVASLAVSRRTLPYADLQRELGIDSVRQLEDLLITDCIYGGVVRGRLDQRARCFQVEDAMMRDVQPESLNTIVLSLSDWLTSARQVLGGIDAQVGAVAASTAAIEKHRIALDAEVEAARSDTRSVIENRFAQEGTAMAMDEGDMVAMLESFTEGEGRVAGPRNTKRRR
jgi:COP9 signalosome complex subunit 7